MMRLSKIIENSNKVAKNVMLVAMLVLVLCYIGACVEGYNTLETVWLSFAGYANIAVAAIFFINGTLDVIENKSYKLWVVFEYLVMIGAGIVAYVILNIFMNM